MITRSLLLRCKPMLTLPLAVLICWLASWSSLSSVALADTEALSQRQSGVAQRYQRLEELLLRLADVEAAENPERAALLRRAARQSRDKLVLERLRTASESLRNQEFQKAIDSQGSANQELASLLKLLMSEDRSKRIRDEKERYAKLIKDLKRNLNNQRSARARNENGADLDQVEKEQQDVTERSQELNERLKQESEIDDFGSKDEAPTQEDENEAGENPEDQSPEEDGSKSEEQKSGEQKSGEQKSGEQKSGEQKSGEQKSGEQKSGEQAQPQTPEQRVQERLEQAIEKMQQAEQELDEAKRGEAAEEQREAEENLRAAIEQLERILRQLREEEMQRELAKLESRLRKMVAMQTEVFEKTKNLAATPRSQRDRTTDLKAGDLGFEEKKITLEADRAMLLLREEGSSVAFPEVVSGIRDDTLRVAERMARTQIDVVTQGIQEDILASLEEMITALQKAQRDLEQQQQEQQQGKPGQPQQGEQPLVESLAELKLLRSIETQIKSTTERYAGLIESGESTSDEVLPLLRDLSDRQIRLYQITRDLVLKRNQ